MVVAKRCDKPCATHQGVYTGTHEKHVATCRDERPQGVFAFCDFTQNNTDVRPYKNTIRKQTEAKALIGAGCWDMPPLGCPLCGEQRPLVEASPGSRGDRFYLKIIRYTFACEEEKPREV